MTQEQPIMKKVDMGIGYGLLGLVLIVFVILTPACYFHSWMGKKK